VPLALLKRTGSHTDGLYGFEAMRMNLPLNVFEYALVSRPQKW